MSEENDKQPPLQTDAPADRPRRPRRRFPRRHNGPRDRAPQDQRGDLNGPGERVESAGTDEMGGAPRVNEGDQRDESMRGEGGPSQNGEIEREPEFGDGIIEISGKGFGFLRDAKRNFVQTPNDIFVTPEIVRRFALRDGMWIYGETRRGNRGPQLIRLNKINEDEPTKYQGLRPFE
jgi:transcription termination factor Rho